MGYRWRRRGLGQWSWKIPFFKDVLRSMRWVYTAGFVRRFMWAAERPLRATSNRPQISGFDVSTWSISCALKVGPSPNHRNHRQHPI